MWLIRWGVGSVTFTLYVCAACSELLPKGPAWKEEKQSKFIAQKPDRQYLSHVVKVNVHRYKPIISMFLR